MLEIFLPMYTYEYLSALYDKVEKSRWKTGEIVKNIIAAMLAAIFMIVSGTTVYYILKMKLEIGFLWLSVGLFFLEMIIFAIIKKFLSISARKRKMFVGNFLKNTRFSALMQMIKVAEKLKANQETSTIIKYPEAYTYIAKIETGEKTEYEKIAAGSKYYNLICDYNTLDFSVINDELAICVNKATEKIANVLY